MTFAAFEGSVSGGRPIELYEFVLGSLSYTFASSERDVTIGPKTWTASEIKRSNVVVGSETRKEILTLNIGSSHPLVRRYINSSPGQRATLNVLRFHPNDPDVETRLIFKGILQTVGFDLLGKQASIITVPITDAQSRQGPRYDYSSACNHVVYDARCKVNSALFRHQGEVTAVSGRTITIDGLSAKGDGWATAGYITLSGVDYRTIIGHTGNVITLMQPFPSGTPDVGTLVEVFAGCDRSLETCDTKFGNVPNFHGWRFVPLRDPFGRGIKV